MKNISRLVLLIFILFSSIAYSQGLKIGFGGGITNIQGPDSYTDDISEGGRGFASEFHLGLKAKLSIPLFPFAPTGFIVYHILNGSQSTSLGEIKTSQTVLSIGAGGEVTFIPGPLSPYFAVDLALNNFSDFEREAPDLSGGNITSGGFSRSGAGVGIGVELSLLPIGVDVNAKYHFLNLIGKESDEETISLLTLNLTVFL